MPRINLMRGIFISSISITYEIDPVTLFINEFKASF